MVIDPNEMFVPSSGLPTSTPSSAGSGIVEASSTESRGPVHTPALVTYLSYPLIVGGAFASAVWTRLSDMPDPVMVPILVTAIVLSIAIERLWPLDQKWSMSRRSFFRRDLFYIVVGLVLDRGLSIVPLLLAVALLPDSGFGPLADLPLVPQAIVAALVFDFCWYWYHRIAHGNARLWRIHGAHHAPRQMYVLMHGVFHPLDEVVVRFVLPFGIYRLLGFTPDAAWIAIVLIGVVGIVSHINADLRIWAFNQLLIGPETHRYHHSADDQGNYGAFSSIWDQLFGSFIFSPDPPERLGLHSSEDYPDPERFVDVLSYPFRRS